MSTQPQVVFYERADPPLESGDYSVSLKHRVKHDDAADPKRSFDETFSAGLRFAVQGVRFALAADDVHAQFPAPGAQGNFTADLPHVTLTAETLPWQRDAGYEHGERGAKYPWLALLAFDETDPPPPLCSGTVADLQHPPAGTVSYPHLETLEYGEKPTDPCQWIDVPVELFSAIAPTAEELRWLAHARRIDQPPDAYANVVSNRLPRADAKTVCCLVSVENMAPLLPTAAGPSPTTATTVRLAVLNSWSFGCVPAARTFRSYLEEVAKPPTTLQVPYRDPGGNPSETVKKALEMGYAAFDHVTRRGARTVSWYRGPLLPYATAATQSVPVSSADALTRYDPSTGMFDVSLAAAWQIGRLLALDDKDFATLLYNWKHGRQQAAIAQFEQEFLAERLGADPELVARGDGPAHARFMVHAVKPILARLVAGRED